MTVETKDRRATRGFTLIEMLVSVAVIAILLALLLYAIQSARASSRKVTCLSNLGQLGLALHGYLSAHGCFPGGYTGRGYSIHSRLLPFLEQVSLYNAINHSLPSSNDFRDGSNTTAALTRVPVFLCPADDIALANSTGPTNYPGSRGVERREGKDNGFFSHNAPQPTKPQDITDGASSTVAMSEWLLGPQWTDRRDRARSIFDVPGELEGKEKFNDFIHACNTLDPNTADFHINDKGTPWIVGAYYKTLYNHSMNINDLSCINQGFVQEAAYTAGSLHPGGAQAVFGDGHAQFIKDSIDREVWRALGTRGGGEVISKDQF